MFEFLFVVLALLGIGLCGTGFVTEKPGVVVLGGLLLFSLGMIIYSEGIDFQTGQVEDVNASTTTINYTYSSYTPTNSITVSTIALALIAMGFVACLASLWVVFK